MTSISKSALAVTRTLIGEQPDRIEEPKAATVTGIETVQMVAMLQSRYWPSLFPKDVAQGQLGIPEFYGATNGFDRCAWQHWRLSNASYGYSISSRI